MSYLHKVTSVLLAEEGYCEKSKAAYTKNPSVLYEKTAGAGADNYTKYGKEMHDIYPSVMDFPAYWCDAFVDWGFKQAYDVANAKGLLGGNFDDYTKGSINLYKSKNAFFLRGEKTPEEGDQVFFTNNKAFSGVHHTGLVYMVDRNYIYTIEGNTNSEKKVVDNGGMVAKKFYRLVDLNIYGYGRPNYAKYEATENYYHKGESVSVLEYVGPDFAQRVTGLLTVTQELLIRSKPDFAVRDRWFKTDKGYISAYRVEGDVADEYGTWTEQNDHKYLKACCSIQNGKEYHYDSNGYKLGNGRFNEDYSVKY